MTDFIRPDLRDAFWRWREAVAGLALALLGVWGVLVEGGLLAWLGGVALLLAGFLIWTGTQRARFRRVSGGPGSVDVDEGQITYFGPLTGGAIALRDIDAVTLIRAGGQSPHWQLVAQGHVLHIPIDADGTDALFDAFASLPGLRTERVLAAMKDGAVDNVAVWQRKGIRALP